VMRLFLNTNVSTLDKLSHNSHGDSEPNIAAIKSLQYEAFSLPIEDRASCWSRVWSPSPSCNRR